MTTNKLRPRPHPAFVIAVGLLSVSTASIFIRYAQVEADSLVIAAYRLGLATLILSPYALKHYGGELRSLSGQEILLAAAAGIFLAAHFATWITSLEYTTVTSSVVLVQTVPLWVALLAPVFLHEPVDRRVLWGLGLALAGGAAVSMGDGCKLEHWQLNCTSGAGLFEGTTGFGNFLALAGAWAAAGYLMIGRKLRARISLVAYIYLVYAVAAALLILLMWINGHSPLGYQPSTYLWMVLLALIPQLLGHSSFNWALGHLPASFVSITMLGEPIGSAVLAILLLGEIPSVVKLIGAGMILIGIYLASIARHTS